MALRDVQEYFETALEPFDVGGGALGNDWGAYVSPGNPFTVGEFFTRVPEPPRFVPPLQVVPPVRIQPEPTVEGDSAAPVARPEEVPPVEVIDPEWLPTQTVFEDAPAGIYETNRAETDWDRVYEEYVILNAPDVAVPKEEEEVVDWGDVFSRAIGGAVGGILDPFGAGRATTAFFQPQTLVAGGAQTVPNLGVPVTGITGVTGGTMEGCPPVGPKYAKICLATGVVTPLRRRRRRRLLTSSDIKDLSALKSIVGGAALQGAVVQAVRR